MHDTTTAVCLTCPRSVKRTAGKRNYDLTNHLGNVLTVISDLKLPIDVGANNTIDYLTAARQSISDYGVWGDLLPGRNSNAGDYRHAFNGKEMTTEWNDQTGGNYDYGFRIYDPRLGKFLSVDPLFKSYAMLTPYQFASNRPIDGIFCAYRPGNRHKERHYSGVAGRYAERGVAGHYAERGAFRIVDGKKEKEEFIDYIWENNKLIKRKAK